MRVAMSLFIVLFVIALCVMPAAAQSNDGMDEEPEFPPEPLPEYPQPTGTITGIVMSSVGSHAVPDAVVTLYDEYGNFAPVPNNPQQSSSGIGNNAGIYTFFDVPYGIYNVTAEKGGIVFFAIVDVSGGTATANIVLPEYVETEPAYQPEPVPSPLPRPYYTYVPIKVGKTAVPPRTEEGLPVGLAVVGGIGALLLYGRRNEEE
jgi:hypothetical protein